MLYYSFEGNRDYPHWHWCLISGGKKIQTETNKKPQTINTSQKQERPNLAWTTGIFLNCRCMYFCLLTWLVSTTLLITLIHGNSFLQKSLARSAKYLKAFLSNGTELSLIFNKYELLCTKCVFGLNKEQLSSYWSLQTPANGREHKPKTLLRQLLNTCKSSIAKGLKQTWSSNAKSLFSASSLP